MTSAELFTAHAATLLRFLSRYADPELCEEIAARTWCKIATQGLPAKIKADAPDIHLICGMARGELANYRRTDRSDNVPGEVWEFVPGTGDIDTSSELLETLPSDLRSLAVAIQSGDSAEVWGESQGLSRATAFRTLSRLRESLS